MAVEVVPGIQQLKVPLPIAFLPYVLVYVIKGDDGYTLIDSGWATDDSWNALIEQLGELGIDIKDVAHVIATHIHPDHYGLAGRIRDASSCEVVLHEREQWLGARGRDTTPEEVAEPVGAMSLMAKLTGCPVAAVTKTLSGCRRRHNRTGNMPLLMSLLRR